MNDPVKVTVSDPETGEVLGESVISNDYVLICAGNLYLDGVVAHANGTVQLTVKRSTNETDRTRGYWFPEEHR